MAPSIRLAVAMACLHIGTAHAVRIEVQPSTAGSWILLSGEFQPDDGARFDKVLAATRDASVVVLEGPGGSMKGGFDIGTAIRARQLATLVKDNSACASACADVWLAGAQRYMGATARIGFHSAYTRDWRNSPTESRVGNALQGAYLNRLGLSDRAVAFVTQAAPSQISWLSLSTAKSLGIEAKPYDSTTIIPAAAGATAPLPTGPAVTPAAIERTAQRFPATYFDQVAQRPEVALDYFQSVYADDVTYDGTVLTRAQVMDRQRRQAERWPEQAYTVRPHSVTVTCNPASSLCEVSGITDWEWSSWGRGARAMGSSRFWFQVIIENDTPLIRAETQTVINREGTGPQ